MVKALYGFGVRCRLWDVEIVHDEMSVPRVVLRNGVGDGFDVKVSLSHEGGVAVGFALVVLSDLSDGQSSQVTLQTYMKNNK